MESLDLVDVPDGVSGFEHALSSSYFPMKLEAADQSRPFRAALGTCSVGDICISRAFANGAYRALHNPMPQPREKARMVLMVHETGSDIAIGDNPSHMSSPGCIMLLNTSRKVSSEQLGPATALSVSLPAHPVMSMFPSTEDIVYRPIAADHGSAALLREFVSGLWGERHHIHAQDTSGLMSIIVRLIGLAFKHVHDDEEHPVSYTVHSHFLKLRRFIEAEYANPELSLSMACACLGLSPSYLQLILRKHSVTFRQLVAEQRLERCRDALSDPNLAHLSVTTIAFDNGYQELSHFSRRFTERFGASPRLYRSQRIGVIGKPN